MEKFKCLLDFLKLQRNGLEYLTSKVRCSTVETPVETDSASKSPIVAHIGHISLIGVNGIDRLHKCGVHGTNDHYLKDCKSFKSADSGEKIRMVMVSRACWNCLTPGHKAKYCSYPKNCSVKGCKMWHHELLHEAHSSGKKFGHQE